MVGGEQVRTDGQGYVDRATGAAGTATVDTGFGLASFAALDDSIFRYIDGNLRKRQTDRA